ncbi:MAG: hypothetical protein Q9163_001622 [Psora crenata]
MATRHTIYKHYQRILSSWPIDPLRPEVSFQKAIQRRVDTRLKPTTALAQDSTASHEEAQPTVPPPKALDEKDELAQVNVLYSFLENRYAKKYPLSERMMKPASNPTHYEDLVKELEEAPNRSWLGAKLNKWKGFLRFS